MNDTWISDEVTFTFAVGETAVKSRKIVQISTSYNGDIAFDLRNRLPAHVGISSATAVVSPTGPTVGSSVISGDARTVKFPFSGASAVDYTLTATITDTNSDIFVVKGLVKVE